MPVLLWQNIFVRRAFLWLFVRQELWRLLLAAFVVCAVFLVVVEHGVAQNLRVVTYNTGNGLPTDLVKSTFQDDHGFVWIATDAGLVRFDGRRYILLTELPSTYLKAILQLRDRTLLAIHDLGITRIRHTADTTELLSFLSGASYHSDTTLFYPKSWFEDRRGTLWIGEADAVVRIERGRIVKRYRFAERYMSDSFSRAFCFVEDHEGRLIVSSQRLGTLFMLNQATDTFEPLPIAFTTQQRSFYTISAMVRHSSGTIWIGTNNGIFAVDLRKPRQQWKWQHLVAGKEVSFLAEDGTARVVYCGTWYSGLWRLSGYESLISVSKPVPTPSAVFEKFDAVASNTINHIRLAEQGMLWVSADDGITLVQPTLFQRMDVGFVRPYIQTLTVDNQGRVTATDGVSVLRVSKSALTGKPFVQKLLRVDEQSQGFAAGLVVHGNTLFFGTSKGSLYRATIRTAEPRSASVDATVLAAKRGASWSNGQSTMQIIMKESVQRRMKPIFFLHFDNSAGSRIAALAGKSDSTARLSEYSLWACQAENILRVLHDGTLRIYGVQYGLTASPLVIRAFGEPQTLQTLYVGASGGNYLFRYDAAKDVFVNVSAPLPFKGITQISVTDLAAGVVQSLANQPADSVLWLATNIGLLRYSLSRRLVDTLALPKEVARRSVNAVRVLPDGGVLFTTDQSLNLYRNNQLLTVDIRSGNTTMTTTARNLAVDGNGDIWLGTTRGPLVLPASALSDTRTPQPIFTLLKINGQRVRASIQRTSEPLQRYLSGTFVEAQFSALSYPADRIRYQTRLLRNGQYVPNRALNNVFDTEALEGWSEATFDAFWVLPSLPAGSYTLQVRAQQVGNLWSTPAEFSFVVAAPWFARWWAIVLYVCVFAGTVYGVARWRSAWLERRNRVLQRQVQERTAEIERQMRILDEQAREIEIANTQLQEQNLQLQQLNTEKNEFLGMAAHDLKNPLTSIMMSASTVQRHASKMSMSDILGQMSTIERTSKRMLDIIVNLLDVNAIESGNFAFQIASVNAVEVAELVVQEYRERAVAKQITLYFSTEQPVLLVMVDANALTEILENLVSNAVKYSPPHRNVYVRVSVSQMQKLSSSSNDSLPVASVRIAVQDQGPGLSNDDKARLFNKFAKLSARPTGGEHSTGLGLSIVKRMTEAMGGRVWCESEPGEGATFVVEFPQPHHTSETSIAPSVSSVAS
jgi:signal transduction histidine kinase/ligand-binding sensor domain-containing protein